MTGIDPHTSQKATPAQISQAKAGMGMMVVAPFVDSVTLGLGYPSRPKGGNNPTTRSNASLSKKFINNPWQGSKFSNYVGVDVSDQLVIKGRDGVYVIPNESPLDLTNRITNSGKN